MPAYPSSVWAKALAGWSEPGATEAFALLARESVAVPGEAEARIGEAARANGVWIVTGVTEVDPDASLDALQHAALPRPRRDARAEAPQARARRITSA